MYPKSQLDVFITVLEDDGSALSAALTCASLALADGGVHMFDILLGTSVVSNMNIPLSSKQKYNKVIIFFAENIWIKKVLGSNYE